MISSADRLCCPLLPLLRTAVDSVDEHLRICASASQSNLPAPRQQPARRSCCHHATAQVSLDYGHGGRKRTPRASHPNGAPTATCAAADASVGHSPRLARATAGGRLRAQEQSARFSAVLLCDSPCSTARGRLELTEITPHAVGMLKLVHQVSLLGAAGCPSLTAGNESVGGEAGAQTARRRTPRHSSRRPMAPAAPEPASDRLATIPPPSLTCAPSTLPATRLSPRASSRSSTTRSSTSRSSSRATLRAWVSSRAPLQLHQSSTLANPSPPQQAYFDDIVAGAVCCREEVNKETGNARLYIMTLGCLAAYRRLGLGVLRLRGCIRRLPHSPRPRPPPAGSMMVEYVLELAKRLDKFESVFLCVGGRERNGRDERGRGGEVRGLSLCS